MCFSLRCCEDWDGDLPLPLEPLFLFAESVYSIFDPQPRRQRRRAPGVARLTSYRAQFSYGGVEQRSLEAARLVLWPGCSELGAHLGPAQGEVVSRAQDDTRLPSASCSLRDETAYQG